jgi:hypothetical protein
VAAIGSRTDSRWHGSDAVDGTTVFIPVSAQATSIFVLGVNGLTEDRTRYRVPLQNGHSRRAQLEVALRAAGTREVIDGFDLNGRGRSKAGYGWEVLDVIGRRGSGCVSLPVY